jgi:3-deoxy-D-manno-octulosonic-acid transferase
MLLYRLLIIILSPLIAGHIIWLSIKNRQSRYLWQRLGFNYSCLPKNSLWFHCASVGEVNTLLPLLKNIHSKNPQLKIVITTNTITGGKIVKQQKLDYVFHSYLPFDWLCSIKRFLTTVKPVSLHLMETEIWPNLFTACSNRNIAINIINARLSSKTTSARPWIKNVLKTSLSKVDAIYARSEKDAAAYKSLGAIEKTVSIAGNLKLTTVLSKNQIENSNLFSTDKEYVLVASTHKDEEKKIYDVWKKLNRHELLVIAPRHPERAASIIKQLNCHNIAIRSKNEAVTGDTEIFLLDTVGELKNYFPNAKIVIMGGSFVPVGGHNILEPASYNNSVITGPYMHNFKQELELMLDKNAIIQVDSYDKLQSDLSKLLNDDEARINLQNHTAELTQNTDEILQHYSKLILHKKT